MTNHDNWKDLAADYRLTIDELTAKVHRLEETVESEHKMRSTLHKNLDDAYARLRRLDREVVPYQSSLGAWECPECCCAIDEEWGWCPCCGATLDWDSVGEPDWYAEEGERFYRAQVSAPLREVAR